MNFELKFIPKAEKDYQKLDNSQKIIVNKALKKILTNPYPTNQGGYGKPLANLSNSKLAGLLKIKLRSSGIRIVYKLEIRNEKFLVIIIGAREDSKVYKDAEKRIKNIE